MREVSKNKVYAEKDKVSEICPSRPTVKEFILSQI